MITSVSAKRAVFSIRGILDASDGCGFILLDKQNSKTYNPTFCEIKDDSYELILNVESMNKQMPLLSGNYYLMRKEGRGLLGETAKCQLDASIDISKSDDEYIRCSMRQTDTGEIYLSVQTKLPSPGTRSLKKRIIEQGFNAAFQIFNHIIPKSGSKIFITSGSRAKIGGNEEFIYNEMQKRGWNEKYNIVLDFKANIGMRYKPAKMIKFIYNLATSDVIIVDDYYPEINKVRYSKKVSIFQVWHACGAFKTVGLERTDKKGAPPINSKVHKCYTHVPVSSRLSAFHQQEAYGIDFDKFYTVGIPRTDVFFDRDYMNRICREIYEEYPRMQKASRVILYAPTFRGESALDAHFPFEQIDLMQFGKMCRDTDSYLIVKMHPFVKEKISIPKEYKDYILDVSDYREVNDLLFVTDILVTDYSSVIYEFSLLRRPMLFYAFDEEEYVKDRDFYESYEETVPGDICHTFGELMDALRSRTDTAGIDKRLENFIDKNFTYTDGKATQRVVDLIESCLKER